MKVTITLDDELMQRIDDYAKTNYTSRSGFLALAATEYLNSREIAAAMVRISYSLQKMADDGVVNEESLKEIKAFESLVKFLSSNDK